MTIVRRSQLKPSALTPLERSAVAIVDRSGVAGVAPDELRTRLGIRERSMWLLAARLLDRDLLRLREGRLYPPVRS
jgi:hypothetical protein